MMMLLICFIVGILGNFPNSTLPETTQSDWVASHTVFLGVPANSQSQILMNNQANETKIITVNITLTDIKTHSDNKLDKGYLLVTDSNNDLFYIDLENEIDTPITTSNVIHFGFGASNIQVLYITNFGDHLYEYNISSGQTFVHVLPSNSGGYGAHNLAIEENEIICHMGKSNYEDIMIKYDIEAQVEIFTFHTYRTFGTKITSSEPYYSSYWGYESLSLSMNQTVYTHNNDVKLWNEIGDLIYLKTFNFTKILCSVYADGYLGLVLMEQVTQKCYLRIIDISTDQKVIEREVIAPSLKICSMKYFIDSRTLSLHMYRSDQIVFLDISLFWSNKTNDIINNTTISNQAEINIDNNQNDWELQEQNVIWYQEIRESMNQKTFQTITNTSSIIVGLLMSSPLANIGVRPLFNFIDDFWPYSYHQRQYPQLIEFFIADTNIFSALRINPFNSYNFRPDIKALQSSNKLHQKHDAKFAKYPKDSLFILSVNEVYTFNFAFSLGCFLIFSLLGLLVKYCFKQQENDQHQEQEKEYKKQEQEKEEKEYKKQEQEKEEKEYKKQEPKQQKDKNFKKEKKQKKESEEKEKRKLKTDKKMEKQENKENKRENRKKVKSQFNMQQIRQSKPKPPRKKQNLHQLTDSKKSIPHQNKQKQTYFTVRQCWFKFIFSLLLPNTVNIVFFSLLNIKNQYHLTLIDKINSLVTLTSLFIWIVASSCLYLLVYRFWNKESKKIHEVSKEGLKGIIIETVLNNIRGMVRAFIHGIFIYSHKWQLFLLVCADLVIILWINSMRRYYISLLTYLLSLMYLLGFLVFDILLLSEGYYRIQNLDYEQTVGILIIVILCLTLMQMVNLMIMGIIDLCRKLQIIKNNRVQPKNQTTQLEGNNETRKNRCSKSRKKLSKLTYNCYFQPIDDASNTNNRDHEKPVMMVEIRNISYTDSAQSVN